MNITDALFLGENFSRNPRTFLKAQELYSHSHRRNQGLRLVGAPEIAPAEGVLLSDGLRAVRAESVWAKTKKTNLMKLLETKNEPQPKNNKKKQRGRSSLFCFQCDGSVPLIGGKPSQTRRCFICCRSNQPDLHRFLSCDANANNNKQKEDFISWFIW